MKTTGLTVLLLEPNKKQNEHLTGILIENQYQVISVRKVESAVKKLLEFSPDIVICQKMLDDSNGFQFYSMLKSDMLNKSMPFILLLNEFNKDDLSVGIELGIDSFLFPPFEPEKINNILQKQSQKSAGGRQDTVRQLRSVFQATPFGMFVIENKKIVDANPAFYQLVRQPEKERRNYGVDEIFNFNSGHNHELNLLRFLNGLSSYGTFSSVPLVADGEVKFNIYLSFTDDYTPNKKIIGLLVPVKEEAGKLAPLNMRARHRAIKLLDSAYEEPGIFTAREKQILMLSAQGSPIKQIAAQLNISERTVEKHRSNIIRKTKTSNITEAVFWANNKQLLQVG